MRNIVLQKNSSDKKGFMALTATIIMATILLLVIVTVSTTSFFSRFDALNSEFKRVSLGLSESCLNSALLKISQNYNYNPPVGGETVNIGPDSCVIKSVTCVNSPCEDPTTHTKKIEIKTHARYPAENGSWSTNKLVATVKNPAYSPTSPPPTCSIVASPSTVPAGMPITVQWSASSNTTSFQITPNPTTPITPAEAQGGAGVSRTYTAAGNGPVTFTGIATNSSGISSSPCTSTVTVTPPPPSPECADTVMMMDRTNSTSGFQTEMGNAAKALLNLYKTLTTPPQIGIGDYGDLYGTVLPIHHFGEIPTGIFPQPVSGLLTNNYGSENPTVIGPNTPSNIHIPSAWTNNPDYGRLEDSLYATDSTNGHLQGYSNFGFSVPSGLNISGIEAIVDGMVSVNSQPTPTLNPNGQGAYTAWNNGEGFIDETGTPVCTAADSIIGSVTGSRESVNLNLSTVPDGSTITSVQVFVTDVADTIIGGSYQTFVRNVTDTDSGVDLTTNSLSGCTAKSQTIDIPDFVKSAGTDLEVGVLKTGTNTNAVRIGTIRAIVNYTLPATSNIDVNLSYDNGGHWSTTRTLTLNSTESPQKVGSSSDSWGRAWVSGTDFTNPNFVLRIKNAGASGNTVSVNYIKVKIYYTNATGLYKTINTIYPNPSATSGGGTSNLSDGITVANNELNRTTTINGSAGHDPTKRKVMIFVADGKPDYPDRDPNRLLVEADKAKKGPDGIPGNFDDTEIFSIYFGSATLSQRDLMAQVSSGSVPVSGHEPGSKNDTGASTDQAVIDTENADNDHFFIAPDAAAMAEVFTTVGTLACPALSPACSNTIDDDGDGFVDASDPSCHVGDVISGAYDPNDNDEWTATAPPPPPPPPPTPPPISIGSWSEVIDVP